MVRLQRSSTSARRNRAPGDIWLSAGLAARASLDGHLPLFPLARMKRGHSGGNRRRPSTQRGARVAAVGARRQGSARFDLGLPGAAITSLEQFTIPGATPDVRINGRSVKTRLADGQSKVEGKDLGRVDHLEMIWKGPAPATAKGKAILAADGKISVRVEDKTVTTDVDLTLQTLRGEAKAWKIFLPPGAVPELREPLPQDERIEAREMPGPGQPWMTIKLKEASASRCTSLSSSASRGPATAWPSVHSASPTR